MMAFTPLSGLAGGLLIGLSAATLLLLNGDILGASGLASFLVSPPSTLIDPHNRWKLVFLATFGLASRLSVALLGSTASSVSPLGFSIGGLLVGFGTRLGNGCTTGHGICGLARRSSRSLVAVLAFMTTGVLAATACSKTCPLYPHLRQEYESGVKDEVRWGEGALLTTVNLVLLSLLIIPFQESTDSDKKQEERENDSRKIVPSMVSAALFSLGLVISKMTEASKIYGFLNFKGIGDGTWDPTLLCVMGGGLLISFGSYQWVQGYSVFKNSSTLQYPIHQKGKTAHFNIPTKTAIDTHLLVGEAIFGFGWGVAGLCPGPAMFLAFAGYPMVLLRWWPSFFLGSFLAEWMKTGKAVFK